MTNNGIVNIHGKEYMTVAKRVELAHEDNLFESLNTEVLNNNPVVIKATVKIGGKTYTGISAANPNKAMEKQSPYEVAETSAVGRALGFAGYGIVEGIASADEVINAENQTKSEPTRQEVKSSMVCPKDGGNLIEKVTKTGKKFLKCENGGWDKDAQKPTGCDFVLWSTLKKEVAENGKKNGMTVEEYENPDNYDFEIPIPDHE